MPELVLEALWLPIAGLSTGLGFVLDGMLRVTHGSVGVSIVLLGLAVRIGTHPLLERAERWQRDVDEKRARLEPALASIRRRYRGEERATRTLDLYRTSGVHPLHGLRSLLGVAVQLPVLVAACYMLEHHAALAGASFLWVADLSQPDRVATLPLALPVLGDGLHPLPLLMTAMTLASSRLHDDPALSDAIRRSRRRGLYVLAALFLLLLYRFPAGVVLYWTTGNAISLVRRIVTRSRGARCYPVLESGGVDGR